MEQPVQRVARRGARLLLRNRKGGRRAGHATHGYYHRLDARVDTLRDRVIDLRHSH
jgi:hypothetical protein